MRLRLIAAGAVATFATTSVTYAAESDERKIRAAFKIWESDQAAFHARNEEMNAREKILPTLGGRSATLVKHGKVRVYHKAHICFARTETARLMDLDVSKARATQVEGQFWQVRVPCKEGKKCSIVESRAAFVADTCVVDSDDEVTSKRYFGFGSYIGKTVADSMVRALREP